MCCCFWCCIIVFGGGSPHHGCFRPLRCLVVVVVVGVLSSSLVSPYSWWRIFVIVFVSFSLSSSASRCHRQLLVAIAVSSLSEAASLLVSASVGFCALSSLLPLAFCRRCWCLLVVGVVGVSLSSAAFLCRRFHRLLVVVVGISLLLSESCQCLCLVVFGNGFPPCG